MFLWPIASAIKFDEKTRVFLSSFQLYLNEGLDFCTNTAFYISIAVSILERYCVLVEWFMLSEALTF